VEVAESNNQKVRIEVILPIYAFLCHKHYNTVLKYIAMCCYLSQIFWFI